MSIAFYLKKVIGALMMPLPVITMLLIAAVVLLWFSRRQVLGKILVAVALVLLYVLSLPFIPYAALTALENGGVDAASPGNGTVDAAAPENGGSIPANADPADGALDPDLAGVRWVVVLSGGGPGGPAYSSINRIGGATLVRLAEGIRVWRLLPDARLIVSGGDWEGDLPSARVMRDAAVDLGVDSTRIVVEDRSWDTGQSAAYVAEVVGNDRMALVTAASHMKRALVDFRRAGLDPVPIRAGYAYTKPIEMTPFTFSPVPGNLTAVTAAWHEVLGATWARLTGD